MSRTYLTQGRNSWRVINTSQTRPREHSVRIKGPIAPMDREREPALPAWALLLALVFLAPFVASFISWLGQL